MKWLATALLASAVVCVSAAAAPAPEQTQGKDSEYYPMQDGNAWTYRVGDKKFQLKIAKHEKVGEVNCARVEMLEENSVKSSELIGVTAQGVSRFRFEDKDTSPPILILKLPPKKDETWKVDSTVGKTAKAAGETLKGTFKAGEEKEVTVPAGKYTNVITAGSDDLDANGQKIGFTYYFAKDVGMVKQVIDLGGQKVTIELEKFEPAPKK